MKLRILLLRTPPEGFRRPAGNKSRVELAVDQLECAAGRDAHLAVLPAGFLRARADDEVETVAEPIVEAARKHGIALVIGVDTCSHARAKNAVSPRAISEGRLPFYVVCADRTGTRVHRQRSTTSANGRSVPEREAERRIVRCADKDVDVLACGEVFSSVLRERLGPWCGRTVVAPSHTAHGARFHHAERWFAGAGAVLLRSAHAYSGVTPSISSQQLSNRRSLGSWIVTTRQA